MKKRVLQDVKIGIFAACLICALIFTVLAFLPESGPVEVSGKFTTSSAPINLTDGTYEVFLQGVLRNKTDRTVVVERVEFNVEGLEKAPYAEGIVLQPHAEESVGGKTVLSGAAGKVRSVRVTVEGKTRELRNPAVSNLFRHVLVPCFLTLLFAALTAHAIIVRVYMKQAGRIGDPDDPVSAGA